MNNIDTKLYELFSPYDIELDGIVEEVQLHDVFRSIQNKNIGISLELDYDGYKLYIAWGDDEGDTTIPYNPTLPLMLQEDSTKSQLISLFS